MRRGSPGIGDVIAMELFIAALVFVFVLFVIVATALGSPARAAVQQRLDAVNTGAFGRQSESGVPEANLETSFVDRVLRPGVRSVFALIIRLTPGGESRQVRAKLIAAGNPGNLGPAEFLALRILSIVVFSVLGVALAGYLPGDVALLRGTIIVAFVTIGLSLPDSLLNQAIAERKIAIRKGLPDTIDLLIVSVEAGMGFDGAVSRVVEKVRGPLSDELARMLQEMRLGMTRSDALKAMSARVAVDEITTFVAAIYQADQLGVGIAKVLRIQSDTVRTTRLQKIREEAGMLPVKMMFPLVFFVFPALFVVLLGPAIIHLMNVFK